MVFFFLDGNKIVRTGKYKANVVLTVFFIAIFITPWILRNYHLFGIKSIASSRAEFVLLSRAMKTDYSLEKIKTAYVYSFSEYLGSRFFPDAAEKPRDFLLEDDHFVFEKQKYLLGQGYTEKEVASIFKEEAMMKIKKHPFKYILQTPLELLKMMSFMHLPSLNDPGLTDKFKDIKGGLILLSSIKGIYKFTGYFIISLALIGAYLRKEDWKQYFIVLSLIFYINGIYSLLYGYARYSVPLIAFYFMFVSIVWLDICKRWGGRDSIRAEK